MLQAQSWPVRRVRPALAAAVLALAGCRSWLDAPAESPVENAPFAPPAVLSRDAWQSRASSRSWLERAARLDELDAADARNAVSWELAGVAIRRSRAPELSIESRADSASIEGGLHDDSAPAEIEVFRPSSDEPLDVVTLCGTLGRDANRLLDPPHGWNVGILLAQFDPERSAHFEPMLRQLVLDPPRLPPESDAQDRSRPTAGGKWFPTGASPGARTGAGGFHPLPLSGVSIPMRCAAAEAWCQVLVATGKSDPIEALAPAGRAIESEAVPASVRHELIRVVARWIPPADIPGVARALDHSASGRSAPRDERLAAIEACLVHAVCRAVEASSGTPQPGAASPRRLWDAPRWPETIDECRTDPDARTRRHYGRWLALSGAPLAFARLKDQLSDEDVRVREDACISLGILGTSEALAELLRQSDRSEERAREFAVRGLAFFGPRELAPFARDASFHVRLAAAGELRRHATTDGAVLLRQLVGDRDPQVQQAAARAAERWPDDLATPILLAGLESSSRGTRSLCFREVRRRVPTAGSFDVDAPASERRAAVARLVSAARLPTGFPVSRGAASDLPDAGDPDRMVAVSPVLEALALQPPRSPAADAAWRAAESWTAGDVPAIERWLETHPDLPAGAIERELLPRLSPVHRHLVDLTHADVFVRRRAAQALAQESVETSLAPRAVRTLADRMVHEQDQLVWRFAISAVLPDGTPEGARVAELAARHAWPDIRILGCEFAARHGQPEFAEWLLPLLHDANGRVQLAATEAAGRCGNPIVLDGRRASGDVPAQPGLRSLLSANDVRLRVAAAGAMSRLGDTPALEELARLGSHESPEARAWAVREMGQSGQPRIVEPLIRLGWTERNDAVRRSIVQALEHLVPEDSRPARLPGLNADEQRIAAWMEWLEQRRTAPTPLPRAGRQGQG